MSYFVSGLQSAVFPMGCNLSYLYGIISYYVVFFGGKDDVNKKEEKDSLNCSTHMKCICGYVSGVLDV